MKLLIKCTILAAAIIGVVLLSCKKEKEVTLPIVTTDSVFNVGPNDAQFSETVVSNGGATIKSYGVCWNTSHNPTVTDNNASYNNSAGYNIGGYYTQVITNLSATTTYYARAFATNSAGTGYGQEVSFTTSIGTITDNEGNVYKIVLIGKQLWMAENLKTRHYNNSDTIATTYPMGKDISNESEPKYQWPCNGDTSLIKTYGRLYTWYVVSDSRGVCPTGWHVPTYNEWETLSTNVGGYNALKEKGTTHWQAPNTGADNSSGFTALPAGFRIDNGTFKFIGLNGFFTMIDLNSIGFIISISYSGDNQETYANLDIGYSVRCLKN